MITQRTYSIATITCLAAMVLLSGAALYWYYVITWHGQLRCNSAAFQEKLEKAQTANIGTVVYCHSDNQI